MQSSGSVALSAARQPLVGLLSVNLHVLDERSGRRGVSRLLRCVSALLRNLPDGLPKQLGQSSHSHQQPRKTA